MPKPDLAKVYADPEGSAFRDAGKGFTRIGFIPSEIPAPQREILKRTGPLFETSTALNVVSLGPGWALTGDVVTIANLAELLTTIQVYRNGQLLTSGAGIDSDVDVYFIDVDTIAFTFSIRSDEVLQIWKNFYS